MFRGGIGPTEILIILGIVVLLFGGKKLPELARGSGRALRIFKTEVKDLGDDDKKSDGTAADDAAGGTGRAIESSTATSQPKVNQVSSEVDETDHSR